MHQTILPRLLLFLLASLAQTTPALAQLEKTFHQAFSLDDSSASLLVTLPDSVVLQKWAGNAIMAETSVRMENASPGILENLLREGRYKLLLDKNNTGVTLKPANPKRISLKTKTGYDIYETVTVRVFYPETMANVEVRQLNAGGMFIQAAAPETQPSSPDPSAQKNSGKKSKGKKRNKQ